MKLIAKLLTRRFAVLWLVLFAGVFAVVGLIGWTHTYAAPTAFVYPSDGVIGTLSPAADDDRTVTKSVNADGVPVLSLDEPWPLSGVRCGPAKPTLAEVDMRLIPVSMDIRSFPSLLPQNPVPVGNLQAVDEAGNAACIYYSAEFQPADFSEAAIRMVREQGPLLVQLVFSNNRALDDSIAPQSVVSETFWATAGEPGPLSTIVEAAPPLDFDTSTLDEAGTADRQALLNQLGALALGMAGLCLLLTPLAALLPIRQALAAERQAADSFLTANPDPVLTTDLNGQIVRHSEAMASLLKTHDLKGHNIDEFINQQDQDPSIDLTENGAGSLIHPVATRSDGTTVPVEISQTRTVLGGFETMVYVIRDATDREQAAVARAQIAAAEAHAAAAGEMLAFTHHSLNREVLGVGFALDDLLEDPTDPLALEELKSAYSLLEQGRDELYAIATLSRYERSPTRKDVTAEELRVVGHDGITLEYHTIEPLEGVDPLIIRLAITNATRNAAAHGKASVVSVTTYADALLIRDNGGVDNIEGLRQAFDSGLRSNGTTGRGLQIIKRCAQSAGGRAEISGNQSGVTIHMNFAGGEKDDIADRGRVAVG